MMYDEEKLNVTAIKLYNDSKSLLMILMIKILKLFFKLIEVINDGNKYNETEIRIIQSKFIALVFGNGISR